MTTLTLSQTELLTQQGMHALQANDKMRAYDLLSRAIELEPHNEQAWLWLSGAVESSGERRYCLEQVLVINPYSAAAQRGMKMLPVTLPISPFPEPAPPEPTLIDPASGSIEAFPAGLALAALAPASVAQTNSLLDLIDQPDSFVEPATRSAPTGAIGSAEPAVVTYAPPPIAVPTPMAQAAAATGTPDQALADLVVREFGRHRSREEVVRTLSEQHRMAWSEAEALVARVASERRRSIAARQSPFLICLGVATVIGGCILVGRGIFVLWLLRSDPVLVQSVNPRAVGISIAQMGLGVVMILGALIGLGQTIKGLFK